MNASTALGAGGPGFKSRHPDQFRALLILADGPASAVCGGVRRRAGQVGVYQRVGVRADVLDGAREPLAGW